MNVSRLSENSIKNRYRDISPYGISKMWSKSSVYCSPRPITKYLW
ncbi:unnamed protein product [Schistosoma margrebowiei]|uniref:Uncharacterized protein n=1 Tax=Schistosoma margrebowiei TaxID=48269 RepID=A0A183N626_9TREM|nr:unnamed protein product [Schistosoma margrebowiei]